MSIIVKNKDTLIFDNFIFRCCVGKNGFSKNKTEGDKRTPVGNFKLNCLYYRADRKKKPLTKLKLKIIKKQMGWCDDINSKKYYNKLIKTSLNLKHEKLFRKDYKYDLFVPIKYNWNKTILRKGSAIFIHLTKNYKPTAGCIGLSEKDFLILIKLINKNTTIKIL
tara:strand:+ start:562 stop:1056 length:495 start_codon:yes stop_codon:yes gene_type:complete